MEKKILLDETRFGTDLLRECIQSFTHLIPGNDRYEMLTVNSQNEEWKFDDVEDFLAEYRESWERFRIANLWVFIDETEEEYKKRGDYRPRTKAGLMISVIGRNTEIAVNSSSRTTINQVMAIFQDRASRALLAPLPEPEKSEMPELRVFIGHGRDPQWRDLKDHLADHHGYRVEAYESGARAGHTIRDVLADMLDHSTFAILVMTGEDETSDGGTRARQNVVHEVGLFQGRIGFHRAIVVVEEGVEVFSNLQGINQIRYSKGNIQETFGPILATLRREFGDRR